VAATRQAVLTLKTPSLQDTMKLEQKEKMREKLPAYFGNGFAIL
jgi:hypothetical protein